MTSCAILDFDEPQVRIKLLLPCDFGFHVRFGNEVLRKYRHKEMLYGPCGIERSLRRRTEQGRRAIETGNFHEDGSCLFRAAAADRGKGALGIAAADICRDPDRTF